MSICQMPVTILDTEERAVGKTDKIPALLQVTFQGPGEQQMIGYIRWVKVKWESGVRSRECYSFE